MLFDNKELVEIAQVAKTYGLNGHLSLKFENNFSDDLLDEEIPVFLLIEGLPVPFFVEDYKNSGGYVATKFKYIDSAEAAEKYVGCKVLVFADDVQDDEEFDEELELVGYKVFDAHRGFVGEIADFTPIVRVFVAVSTHFALDSLSEINSEKSSSALLWNDESSSS